MKPNTIFVFLIFIFLTSCTNSLEQINYSSKKYTEYHGLGFPVYDGLESFVAKNGVLVIQTPDSAQFQFLRFFVDTNNLVYGGKVDTFFHFWNASVFVLKVDSLYSMSIEMASTKPIDSTKRFEFTKNVSQDIIIKDSSEFLALVDSLKPKPLPDFLKEMMRIVESNPDSTDKLLEDYRYQYNKEYLNLPDTVN